MNPAPNKRTLAEGPSPPFYAGRKIGEVEKALLWKVLHEAPQCPSRVLLDTVAQRQAPISVSVRQINRLRLQWHLKRRKGRPRQTAASPPGTARAAVTQVTPHLSCVGVHLFAHWLEQHDAFTPVVARLTQATETSKRTHPEADFALLHHREHTLLRRWQAVFFAPLLGINTLTGFDPHEHPLETLLGRGYHGSTLSQFLGQLERLDAAPALLPALVPQPVGQITYVDGHMMASWARVSMHKGKSTMLGRIMAGSQAVIAHDEEGQALYVVYYPPAMHLSPVIVAYCQQVAAATGTALFVIDRAVNAVAMARAFDTQGWGLLCMLDDNEHHGLSSVTTTWVGTRDAGTQGYSGQWKAPRPDDPRHFVIVEPVEGKTLVDWGTPKVKDPLEATQWPRVYHHRSERQENSVKRMIEHGALNTNYGRKKIIGPDRHQQRAGAKLDKAQEGAQQQRDKKARQLKTQQDKVAESTEQGHTTRLHQRQQTHATLAEHANAFGPPTERADRDFRTQTIMTFRTLLLENALTSFMVVLLGMLQTKVSLERLLSIFFARSGARMETGSQIVYWVNTVGVSAPYQRLLREVVEGLCKRDLQCQGKPIRVRLKDMPP